MGLSAFPSCTVKLSPSIVILSGIVIESVRSQSMEGIVGILVDD